MTDLPTAANGIIAHARARLLLPHPAVLTTPPQPPLLAVPDSAGRFQKNRITPLRLQQLAGWLRPKVDDNDDLFAGRASKLFRRGARFTRDLMGAQSGRSEEAARSGCCSKLRAGRGAR
ncbi:hypothetical protein MRX96_030811 [Rhipicephalus microplus]